MKRKTFGDYFRKKKEKFTESEILKILNDPLHKQFEEVRKYTYELLVRKSYNMPKIKDLAPDHSERQTALNNAFLDFMDSIGQMTGTNIHGYFYSILVNRCIDLVRKKSAVKSLYRNTVLVASNKIYQVSDEVQSKIEEDATKNNLKEIEETIKYLSKRCQEVLSLFLNRKKDKEIAQAMNLKYETAKKTRQNCIKDLKERISGKN